MAKKLNIWCGQFDPKMGDLRANIDAIKAIYFEGVRQKADVVIFPELAICGYPPEDLLLKKMFINNCVEAVKELAAETQGNIPMLVGAPWPAEGFLFNAAILLKDGIVNTIACKTELPNYGVFDERRYFEPAPGVTTCTLGGYTVGIAVCEDVWFPRVCKDLKAKGAEVILSINASPYQMLKTKTRCEIIRHRVEETQVPLLYVNLLGGQDELIFDGRSFGQNPREDGPAFMGKAFKADQFMAVFDGKKLSAPEVHYEPLSDMEDIYQAVVTGTRDYVVKNGFDKGVVLGLSGGVDSALAAKIAVDALGPDKVVGILMPSPYSSDHSLSDAAALAKNLGIKTHTIPIKTGMKAFDTMLSDLFAGTEPNVAEENIQARLRGMLLMAFSNKFGHMVLTTGNKSEMSVGYATLYGDMNGGYNPLKDLYKTTVFELCRHINRETEIIPENIITKPPSAELRPDQVDSDSLPDYAVLDDILYKAIEGRLSIAEIINESEADAETVRRIIRLLRRSEYKRRQAPPGVKITSIAFGRDFRFPITNSWLEG